MKKTPPPILLVEDDVIDTQVVKRQLRKHDIQNPLVCVEDGTDALAFLKGQADAGSSESHIVLLDINLPRMNGFQLLQEMRNDPRLHRNVVFMLTTSASDADRKKAYDLHAAGYFLKHDIERVIGLVSQYSTINQFSAH